MRGLNICFYGEIRKIVFELSYPLLSGALKLDLWIVLEDKVPFYS